VNKFYITKYALTQGVWIADANPREGAECVHPMGLASSYKLGSEAFNNRDDALARIEELRQIRIESLERQLAKMRGMNPERLLEFAVEITPCWGSPVSPKDL
jgi:hypothetical protein